MGEKRPPAAVPGTGTKSAPSRAGVEGYFLPPDTQTRERLLKAGAPSFILWIAAKDQPYSVVWNSSIRQPLSVLTIRMGYSAV